MALLASEVMDRTRAILNDVGIDLYSNAVLLPYLQMASDDLSDELVDTGATVQKEETAATTVVAGAKTLTLPDDIIIPILIWEKGVGEDDAKYTLLKSKRTLPKIDMGPELIYYEWREQQVNFVGATQDRVVLMRYYRIPTTISGDSSNIELTHAKSYLAYQTAALAADHIAQNLEKATVCYARAGDKLNKLLNREVKKLQANPVRRRGFRINRFRQRLV